MVDHVLTVLHSVARRHKKHNVCLIFDNVYNETVFISLVSVSGLVTTLKANAYSYKCHNMLLQYIYICIVGIAVDSSV